jgi:murein DD-endopeptidase MepM/ murein hydrolase activator NlpD
MSRGGYVRVHNGRGYLHEAVFEGETLNGLAARFAPDGMSRGEFRKLLVRNNPGIPPSALLGNYRLRKGDRVLLPGVYPSLDTYRLPVSGGRFRISSNFGYRFHPVYHRRIFHKGCDIPMPVGTPVYPSRSGTVVFAGDRNGYGLVAEVRHADGSLTRYGHLSSLAVRPGDKVQKSKTLLGKSGSSGVSTGPHLHFEILTASGRSVNPLAKIGRR